MCAIGLNSNTSVDERRQQAASFTLTSMNIPCELTGVSP
jgi:hypothetical protein